MITVKFRMGKRLTLTIKGHAGGEQGKDLVCASASILAYTLAQNVKDAKSLCERHSVKLDEGNTTISCTPKEDRRNALIGIYCVILRGFDLLVANFPDQISLQRITPKHE